MYDSLRKAVLVLVVIAASCAQERTSRRRSGGRLTPPAVVAQSRYRGWETLRLYNDVLALQVAPDLGGRVIQLTLNDFEYFWVNPQLAGKAPPPGGLDPDGEWLNYGGEKLWPAPQGWGREDQWPGPPDAVLDGSPHRAQGDNNPRDHAAIRMTSGKDPRSGIRFSRTIRLFRGSSRVSVDAVMENIDTKPRRWGIWSVAQLNGAASDGTGPNRLLRAYCPVNPASIYPQGYKVMFGIVNNPQFQLDETRGLMRVDYQYLAGKIGLDSDAGWVAVVDGEAGYVFVQRFTWEPDLPYPDDASVEIWTQGVGTIVAWNQLTTMPDDPNENPYLIESELLSPFATLGPGEKATFHYEWYAAAIGGDYPILDVTDLGVVCEPFRARRNGRSVSLSGRFGIFYRGRLRVLLLDAGGKKIGPFERIIPVSPSKPIGGQGVFPYFSAVPATARAVSLVLEDLGGNDLGELARAPIR